MKKFFAIISNLAQALIILFLFAVAGTFLPIPGNYKLYTVQSGSMEPKIRLGSLLFVKPARDYNPGDIVTYKIQGGKTTITHRITEKNTQAGATVYTTKGDANDAPDPQAVSQDAVVGKVFLTLPLIGFTIGYARTQMGFIFLILVPSVIIIYEELRWMALEIRKKINRTAEADKESFFEEEKIWFVRPERNIHILDFTAGLGPQRHFHPPLSHPAPKRKIV